ncbi:MAG: hypothetical protein SGPRY_008194, partial [Prymnesium sp.]
MRPPLLLACAASAISSDLPPPRRPPPPLASPTASPSPPDFPPPLSPYLEPAFPPTLGPHSPPSPIAPGQAISVACDGNGPCINAANAQHYRCSNRGDCYCRSANVCECANADGDCFCEDAVSCLCVNSGNCNGQRAGRLTCQNSYGQCCYTSPPTEVSATWENRYRLEMSLDGTCSDWRGFYYSSWCALQSLGPVGSSGAPLT